MRPLDCGRSGLSKTSFAECPSVVPGHAGQKEAGYTLRLQRLLGNTEPAAKEAELYPELATGLGSKELPISAKTS